jgi:hypothetical protein
MMLVSTPSQAVGRDEVRNVPMHTVVNRENLNTRNGGAAPCVKTVANAFRARQPISIKGVIHMKGSFNCAEMGSSISWPIGAHAIRSLLALGLSIALSASAEAATMHHHRTHHHFIIPPNVASSFAAVPGWAPAPPPARYDDTPGHGDPSRFGGSTALPVQ